MSDMIHTFYGIAIVLGLAAFDFGGLSFAEVDELEQVPKTVRSNPGSYRSHYNNYVHYSGGK